MITQYSTEDQFCYGMSYREWREAGNVGKCPYHHKALRNYNKAEAEALSERYGLNKFLCPISNKWHLASTSRG